MSASHSPYSHRHVGYHVSKGSNHKNYYHALVSYQYQFSQLGLPLSAQIFVMGPQRAQMNMKDADAECIAELTAGGLDVYVHSAYVNSLWSESSNTRAFALHNVRQELEMADKMRAKGLVVHVANLPPQKIIPAIHLLRRPLGDSKKTTTLFLEIDSHGRWPNCYANPVWIDELFEQLKEYNVGLCIDSAHASAVGVDLSSYSAAKGYLDAIKTHGKPILLHLNDNQHPPGSRRDKHEVLGDGTLWATDRTGYTAFFETKFPIIFERAIDEARDMKLYVNWLRENGYYK